MSVERPVKCGPLGDFVLAFQRSSVAEEAGPSTTEPNRLARGRMVDKLDEDRVTAEKRSRPRWLSRRSLSRDRTLLD